MGRRIVTRQYQSDSSGVQLDGYFDRLLKYIPTDIVGAWIAVTGLLGSATSPPDVAVFWAMFLAFLVIAALWTWRHTSEPNKPPAVTQTVIATAAFIVWVFALGGPFALLSFYQPIYGSLLLIVFSLVVPLVMPSE